MINMDIISYRITTSYMCCRIDVNNKGIVIDTAPIMKWARGMYLTRIEQWVINKKGIIEKL